MAPKGGNAKKESGRSKKAENEAKKQEAAAAEKEKKEAAAWDDGSAKASKDKEAKEEKRKAELARKAENARLLAEEEASTTPKVKVASKTGGKKAAKPQPKPAGPGAIAAGGELDAPKIDDSVKDKDGEPTEVESFSATGIDNAIDLLEVVTAKMDKASVGTQAAGIERHPERRFKAAFEAYQERELPGMKQEHPGLRLQQYKDLLYKQFQKSPDNPFNQTTVSYDATKEDKIHALNAKKTQVEDRLRQY
ncbi:hypothetical protein BDP27DRAFT_1270694 [Rhodocollybia butyracea]|uniref:DUF1014-domain-containing protein n=1 Tax=Rhodocollybia butyracea TaxID=206335 RepID=A0A9P5PHW8_9AGAR|nr:hypothetical protein BDP27DRAFT_1270694 [Rhodocollybia butyracea]